MKTINLYDPLPTPTSTEEVLRVGKGSFYKLYSPTDVSKRGESVKLVWQVVGWCL